MLDEEFQPTTPADLPRLTDDDREALETGYVALERRAKHQSRVGLAC